MNFKKTIAKSLVVAMALGMVPVANLQTAKAAAPTLKLTVDGLVTAENAKYWGVAKEAKKAGKDTIHIGDKDYKVTNIMEYPEGGVDATSAFKGKAGVIVIGTTAVPSAAEWGKLDLKAADKSFKVQYVANKTKVKGLSGAAQHALGSDAYGYLVGTKVANKATVEVNLDDKVEVKLNDGNWVKPSEMFGAAADAQAKKLKMASQVGSTFTFRIKGTDTDFASNDAKVKITPQTKGPSVKYDVNKDSANIKKGMDYQVVEVAQNGATVPKADWTTVPADKKSMTATDLNVANDKSQVLFVRNSANDKKIASQYTSVTLNKRPEALKFDGDKIESAKVDIKDSTGQKVIGSIALAVGYDLKKGAALTNLSTFDWEYALGKADPTKWSTLKAPKNVNKPSVAKLKYSETDKPNTFNAKDVKLYLRVAGTKQTKDGVVTLAGVSVNKEVKLKVVEQKLTFNSHTLEGFADNTSALATPELKYTVPTGTAAKITYKATVSNTVKPGTAPKVKHKSGPKLSVKAGKVNNDGTFELTFEASKNTFKTPEEIKDAVFTFNFEGVSQDITLKLTKK